MTRITLTWQKDDLHSEDWDEEVTLGGVRDVIDESSSFISEYEDLPDMFDNLLRQAISYVFDEAIDKFSLLKSSMHITAQPGWNKLLKYKTIAERLMELSDDALKEFQEDHYEKIPYTDKKKLTKELCILITTFSHSALEILLHGTIDKFLSVVYALVEEPKDFQELENEAIRNNSELYQRQKNLTKEKKQFRVDMENALNEIHRLTNLYEDTLEYSKQKFRYTDDWETSRHEQQYTSLTESEDVFNKQIASCKTKMEYESRIHTEVRDYILENTEDMRNDIQYWMAEYDRHTEQLDMDIIFLKANWEKLTEDHTALAILYEEHQIEMEEWIKYRDERNRQIAAAIKIQAWWRGTMVRKKLGPFRVKKKKGKKGKGKKGKGKSGKKGGKKSKKK